MEQKIAITQFCACANKAENLSKIKQNAQYARANGASIIFFPEYAMFYPQENRIHEIQNAAEPLDGDFCSTLSSLARDLNMWIFAGMYEKTNTLPYNTIAVFNQTGTFVSSYRKQKLFDAFSYRESEECSAGLAAFMPIDTPIGTLGIITCYELRFAEYAEMQKKLGADILFLPAGWVAGPNKVLDWQKLLWGRATENKLLVLGVNQYKKNQFTGFSAGFDANGTNLYQLSGKEEMCFLSIDIGMTK